MAFTAQRAYIIFKPFSFKYKSTKSAWNTVAGILSLSLLGSLWVCFFLDIDTSYGQQQHCNVKHNLQTAYFNVTLVYMCLVMFFPMLTIFISNYLIISKVSIAHNNLKLRKNKNSRKKMAQKSMRRNVVQSIETKEKTKGSIKNSNERVKLYYLNLNQI